MGFRIENVNLRGLYRQPVEFETPRLPGIGGHIRYADQTGEVIDMVIRSWGEGEVRVLWDDGEIDWYDVAFLEWDTEDFWDLQD